MGVFSNLKRDYDTLMGARRLLNYTKDIDPESENLAADDIERTIDRYPNNVLFRFEGELTTYAEFEARANRIAHWALDQGLKPGDCVALFMENKPDYVAVWYGLMKVGVVTALINNQLADKALAHCVNIADAKHLIAGAEQADLLKTADGLLGEALTRWSLGGAIEGCEDLDAALAEMSPARPPRDHRAGLRGKDLALYVYTSGTTGLPKAARLTNARTQGMMRTFVTPTKTSVRDRIYVTLPLYHGTGGICGIGIAVMTGASVILRRKFSARGFWDDVADHGATEIVYIGELCRYLLNSPEHPKERAHKLRGGFGNGLRPEVWEAFLERFKIPTLVEFYGSTEGNVSFMNFDGKVGAVGRIPKFLESRVPHIAFVKFDVESEEPVRGEDGFCIRTDPDEVGEAIGMIGDDVRTRFEGYNDAQATEKKMLRDVFEKGDAWFRTGDLMKKDADGYIYFIDRIGDTFRWKGENVATNEVGQALAGHPNIAHANVYGVAIPGMDGKAGMASITPDGDLDMEGLHAYLRERLPIYAVPLFIRIQGEAETTGTFKYRKVELVKDGFNPDNTGDPLWFAHPEKGAYEPLTHDAYETILAGGFRF
ncbi:MAG: long-chain-acyl-CoA synthetase [Pseudomonadota bacterium]